MLPREARAAAWLDPSILYQAVADAGILRRGDPGYDTGGCFGGYAIELSLPSGDSQLLLTASGPQVSNDHYPYYEALFRREGRRLILARSGASFFDIADIEGAEWPFVHGVLVIGCCLVGASGVAVYLTAKAVARWVRSRRL